MGKKIKYGEKMHYGNYVISMFRRPVIDDEDKLKVRELDYFLVQPVNEHLRIELPETNPSFQYLRHLIENDDESDHYIALVLSNMVFVASNVDCFFHNAVKLLEIVSYDPLLLKKGHANASVTNEEFVGMVERLRNKWLEAYEVELKNFSHKSDEYGEDDAREDAAAEAAENELLKE